MSMGLCTLSTLSLIELVMQLGICFLAAACGLCKYVAVCRVLVVHCVLVGRLLLVCRYRPRVYVCHMQAIIVQVTTFCVQWVLLSRDDYRAGFAEEDR